MNNIDFNSLGDTELEALVSAATKEMERRREEREAISWRQVKLAIIDYVNHFSDINVGYGEFYIDGDTDFSKPGQLH